MICSRSDFMIKKNSDDSNVLTLIHDSCKMGLISIDSLLKKATESSFEGLLQNFRKEYNDIAIEVGSALADSGIVAGDVKTSAKMGVKTSVSMKTMMDDSPSHMAEMMIQGADMAIIEVQKAVNSGTLSDYSRIAAQKYLDCEKAHIEKLKLWL